MWICMEISFVKRFVNNYQSVAMIIYGKEREKLNQYDEVRSMLMINDLLGRKKLTGPIK